MKRIILAAAATIAIAASAHAEHHTSAAHAEATAAHQALTAAVAAKGRGDNAARDEWRHPVETIEFFRIEPGMTVIDLFPGGSYYTDILVPYMGPGSRYIGAITTVPIATDEQKESQRAFPDRYPGLIAEAHAEKGISGASVTGLNLETMPEGMEGTVDRILVARFMHNLHRWGMVHDQLGKFRALLKDDGMLGVVQHRAKADAPYSYTDGNKGYLRQADVIKLIEAHGFELVATSEVNANPNDPADHEPGVWYLPPTFAGVDDGDDAERAKRLAIGESDRMTLLFKKRD